MDDGSDRSSADRGRRRTAWPCWADVEPLEARRLLSAAGPTAAAGELAHAGRVEPATVPWSEPHVAAAQPSAAPPPASAPAGGAIEGTTDPAIERATDPSLGPLTLARHQQFLQRIRQGPVGMVFFGDSIGDLWTDRGAPYYNQYYGPYHPADFSVSQDKAQNLLWRLDNGELEGIAPKVAVVMIGTGNVNDLPPGDPAAVTAADDVTVAAVTRDVRTIRAKLPATRVLLLGLLPKRPYGNNPLRARIKDINRRLSALDDGRDVRFLDVGHVFVDKNGNIPATLMPDYAHPSREGFRLWAEAMNPTLLPMLKG